MSCAIQQETCVRVPTPHWQTRHSTEQQAQVCPTIGTKGGYESLVEGVLANLGSPLAALLSLNEVYRKRTASLTLKPACNEEAILHVGELATLFTTNKLWRALSGSYIDLDVDHKAIPLLESMLTPNWGGTFSSQLAREFYAQPPSLRRALLMAVAMSKTELAAPRFESLVFGALDDGVPAVREAAMRCLEAWERQSDVERVEARLKKEEDPYLRGFLGSLARDLREYGD